jgi:hypothetical protein
LGSGGSGGGGLGLGYDYARTYQRPAARPPGGAPPPARWLALAVLCVSLLMVNLDNLVLNVALPTLVRDLHATRSR